MQFSGRGNGGRRAWDWSFMKISERKTPEVAHCVVRLTTTVEKGKREEEKKKR